MLWSKVVVINGASSIFLLIEPYPVVQCPTSTTTASISSPVRTHPPRVMSLIITLQTVCHTCVIHFPVYNAHKSLLQVTDELPAGPKRVDPKSTMIKVQPLKRSEMQVNLCRQAVSKHHSYLLNSSCYIAFLCSGSWNW